MSGTASDVQIALINWMRGTPMPTPPASLEVALSRASISDDASNIDEPPMVSGYARQPLTLTPPVHTEGMGTTTKNDNPLLFPQATADWGTIVAAAVFDQAGNLIFKGDLVAPRSVVSGDTISFGVETLQFRVQ